MIGVARSASCQIVTSGAPSNVAARHLLRQDGFQRSRSADYYPAVSGRRTRSSSAWRCDGCARAAQPRRLRGARLRPSGGGLTAAVSNAPARRAHNRVPSMNWDELRAGCPAYGLRPVQAAQAGGLRRRRRIGAVALHRRGAGRGGGRTGRALRGTGGQAPRRHDGSARHQARARGLHRERREMPPAGESHSDAGGSGRLRTVPGSADRAHLAEGHRRAREDCGDAVAANRGEPREPARPGASLS